MSRLALRALIVLGIAAAGAACRRSAGPAGACGALGGMWRGVGIEADGGDPSAVELMADVARGEQWRVTVVTPQALQRERVGAAGGPPVVEAMYVRESGPHRCVVDLTSRQGARRMTLTLRPDGSMAVEAAGGWFTSIFRRPR